MGRSIKKPEEGKLAEPLKEHERGSEFLRYLEEEVWPKAPPGQLGRRLSREEEDEILGYGPEKHSQENP
jgi:antitoxin VapB